MLTGYYEPSGGSIRIDDIDIITDPISAKKKIGYLPENAPLYGDMTVEEFLTLAADIRELKNKRARIKEIINITGLNEVYNRFIWELSKGYHQRVGIAHALLSDPDFLILDEPTAGLDPNQIVEIRSLIKELGKSKTILLSTHILQEAEAIADKVIIIDKAKIIAKGNKDELKDLLQSQNNILITARKNKKFIKDIEKIDGVLECKIESSDKNYDHLKIYSKRDVVEDIFKSAVNTDTVLRELSTEAVSLEDVFIKLTGKEVGNE
jgi:ABC-2 type transport system ATP-binding protein